MDIDDLKIVFAKHVGPTLMQIQMTSEYFFFFFFSSVSNYNVAAVAQWVEQVG